MRCVRKQYHFCPGEHGLAAWDVDRLIVMSSPFPSSRQGSLRSPKIDTAYWFHGQNERPTVRRVIDHMRLIAQVDVTHPIILGEDSCVMDGMHRIARAILEERRTIRAVRFIKHPEPDYRNCRPEDLPYD